MPCMKGVEQPCHEESGGHGSSSPFRFALAYVSPTAHHQHKWTVVYTSMQSPPPPLSLSLSLSPSLPSSLFYAILVLAWVPIRAHWSCLLTPTENVLLLMILTANLSFVPFWNASFTSPQAPLHSVLLIFMSLALIISNGMKFWTDLPRSLDIMYFSLNSSGSDWRLEDLPQSLKMNAVKRHNENWYYYVHIQ